VLAVALGALFGLALLTAGVGLLAFHRSQLVILAWLSALVLAGRRLVLAFAILLSRLVARHALVLVAIGHRCSPLLRG
jgi:hypothetical protein